MIRETVSPTAPESAALERAAAVIHAGGLVALPTDTLYGVAADPFNATAVARVFLAKGRGGERALPLIAADKAQIEAQLGPLSSIANALAARFWPGPLTILIGMPATVAAAVAAGTGRVGVRVPAHAVARALCRVSKRVLTATSANTSGEAASHDPDVVAASLGAHLDMLLDAGETLGGLPSTVVDVTGPQPRLVRVGAIPWEEIQASLGRV